eukprot:1168118-Prorocentrum_minimum.AAC.4
MTTFVRGTITTGGANNVTTTTVMLGTTVIQKVTAATHGLWQAVYNARVVLMAAEQPRRGGRRLPMARNPPAPANSVAHDGSCRLASLSAKCRRRSWIGATVNTAYPAAAPR